MRRLTIPTLPLVLIGFATATVVAACSSAGSSRAPAATASAMAEESAMANESAMAEESAMADHSAMPSVAAPVTMGTFHGVDGNAGGTAALFHRPDGTFVVTFEDFSVASADHTHVVLVPNKDVTNDGDIDTTTIVDLGPLQGTTGMQDYTVPTSADAMTFHTVVLWDTEMAHAVAAAALG
jgi:hypothetical protein